MINLKISINLTEEEFEFCRHFLTVAEILKYIREDALERIENCTKEKEDSR